MTSGVGGVNAGVGASIAGVGAGVIEGPRPVIGVGRATLEKQSQLEALRAERAAVSARIQLLRDIDVELERRERGLLSAK